ncbi:MAG: hypothetical protein Q4C53_03920 [Clostridia bacterium]|nr:hypothetical protein [Clostridia bacterium]
MTEQEFENLLRQSGAALVPDAERVKRAVYREAAGKERRHGAFPRKAAVAFALAVAVLSGTAFAIGSLFRTGHTTERYLATVPEARETVPSLEAAIGGAAPEETSYRVELVGEYTGGLADYEREYNESIPRDRIASGFAPYDPAEYAFLRGIVPRAEEVYYDGARLTVNTVLTTDRAGDFRSGLVGDLPHARNLDATTFGALLTDAAGNAVDLLALSGGLTTGIYAAHETNDAVDGVRLSTEFGDLARPLPDGRLTLTLLYYVYDGAIDDMSYLGNIGRIVHTFTFDATEGNRSAVLAAAPAALGTGEALLTVFAFDEETKTYVLYNDHIALDELRLTATVQYTPGGAVAEVRAEMPGDWTKDKQRSVFYGLDSGIRFTVRINGEDLGEATELDSSLDCVRLELPVVAEDYGTIRSVELVPVLRTLTSVRVSEGTDADAPFETVPVPTAGAGEPIRPRTPDTVFQVAEENVSQTPLSGCAVVLPLPRG